MRPSKMRCLLVSVLCFGVVGLVRADDAKGKPEQISVFKSGTLIVPATFKRVPVKSRIIEHEFQAQAGEGDDAKTARVTMMAAGGDVEANIARWKSQFTGVDEEAQKTEELKIGEWKVYIVDVAGSFKDSMGGGPFSGGRVVERTDYAMASAILVHPEGRKYFVKMIGPASVVKENREAFVKMIKSIGK